MRVRSLLSMVTGAALGAGAVWLLDDERGQERRRQAVADLVSRGREVDWVAVAERGRMLAELVGERAAEGYRETAGR